MTVVMHQKPRCRVNRLLNVLHVGGRKTEPTLYQNRPDRARDFFPNEERLVVNAQSRLRVQSRSNKYHRTRESMGLRIGLRDGLLEFHHGRFHRG